VRTARDRGIRVIADLVVNHTSKEHPWFQSARADRNSPYRDWYVWRDEIPETVRRARLPGRGEQQLGMGRAGARQYYLHRFYKHQPDLNIANPKVREEIRKIVGFWLELGLSAFASTRCRSCSRPTASPMPWRSRRTIGCATCAAFLGRRRGDAVLMGEVNLEYEDVRRSSATRAATSCTCASTSTSTRRWRWRWCARMPGPLVHSLRRCRRWRRTMRGRTSSATTTNGRSTS
jgi:hypothetical protein